jgi:uncharacterized protein YdhG (YjbR/CyaY superfamily)
MTAVDAYIAAFPEHVQVLLQSVRTVIRDAAPETEEAIRYQMPGYALKGKGSVQFPIDQPMPLDLIRRIVEFRRDAILTAKKSRQ